MTLAKMGIVLSLLVFNQAAFAVATPASGAIDTCFSPTERCDLKLISLLSSATHTLDIAIYAMTHKDIAAAIVAAKKRGVTVRMVVDRQESNGNSSLVGALKTAGIAIKIGNVQGIMHNKFSIIDGRAMETGSFNYTMNATAANAENQIYLSDAITVAKYEADFNLLWANALAQ